MGYCMQHKESKYDPRNKLNDLNGTEWLKLTKSFLFSEKCADDKEALKHPAPFLIKDIEKLISFFTKSNAVVLDPFMGSGTTAIAAYNLHRYAVGIDLNQKYKELALTRFNKKSMLEKKDFEYLVGDALTMLDDIDKVDYIVTSPPYHNILQNNSKGIRKDASTKGFRNGSRLGVDYYSDDERDLGNQNSYQDFLTLF